MFVIRPCKVQDSKMLYDFACKASAGIYNLPKDKNSIAQRIDQSMLAFAPEETIHLYYIFVLENLTTGSVAGTSAINARQNKHFLYQLKDITLKSNKFKVLPQQILIPIVHEKGPIEICGLYLSPDFRKGGLGKLLSLSRLMFMALHRGLFNGIIASDLRGVYNSDNTCPFWEGVGSHFVSLSFSDLQKLLAQSNDFISEFLPPYPILVSLLPKPAQEVINKTHVNTAPAFHMLLKQGFRMINEIDLFDGGPRVAAHLNDLKIVQNCKTALIEDIEDSKNEIDDNHMMILTNTNPNMNFRACYGSVKIIDESKVVITKEMASALNVEKGESICYSF